MKSSLLAAFAALLVVGGTVSAGETAAKPVVGAPLMFKIGGEFKTVALSDGPWSASSTGHAESAHVVGDRYFPANAYLRAEHEGKAVVFRWEASGLKGGAAGWYAYEGEPKDSAPKNTPVVVAAANTPAPVVLCSAEGSCSFGAPIVGEVVQSKVVYTTICNGQTCSQVVLGEPVIYGSSLPVASGTVVNAPAIQQCVNGQCNKNGKQGVVTFPNSFYTK